MTHWRGLLIACSSRRNTSLTPSIKPARGRSVAKTSLRSFVNRWRVARRIWRKKIFILRGNRVLYSSARQNLTSGLRRFESLRVNCIKTEKRMINFSKRPHIGKGIVVTYMLFWIRNRLCCRNCWRNLVVSHSSLYPVLSFALYLRPTSSSSLSRLLSCINWRFSAIWMEKDSWFYLCYFPQLNDYFILFDKWWFHWYLNLCIHLIHSFIHTFFIQKTKNTKCLYSSSSSSERRRLTDTSPDPTERELCLIFNKRVL